MKIIIASALVIGLTACQTPDTPPPVSTIVPDNIKSAVETTCGVVLSAQSLSTVIGMFNPKLQNHTAYAAEICGSLQTLLQSSRGGPVRVSGNFRGHTIVGTKRR